MKKYHKEIIAYCMGDSTNPKTWSSVPYFFLNTLEDEFKIIVHRINIDLREKSRLLRSINKIFNYMVHKIYGYDTLYAFERTRLWIFLVRIYMYRVYKKYNTSDLLISFDFSSSISDLVNTDTLLFCDWTIEYEIVEHQKRQPFKIERKMIKQQYETIKNSKYVVTIFPNAKDEIEKKVNRDVFYFGNVINSKKIYLNCDWLTRKYNSNHILFIGREKYKIGLMVLIKAIELYNKKNPKQIILDVIGMDNVENNKDWINCYGYLNKDNEAENGIYTNLIRNAKCYVNTNPNWIGASSLIEVLAYGTPCIVSKNADLVRTFGDELDFGYYCQNSEKQVEQCISTILSKDNSDYGCLCRAAISSVKDFSWEGYIKKLMKYI